MDKSFLDVATGRFGRELAYQGIFLREEERPCDQKPLHFNALSLTSLGIVTHEEEMDQRREGQAATRALTINSGVR